MTPEESTIKHFLNVNFVFIGLLFLLGSGFLFGHGDGGWGLDFLGLGDANGLARALAGAGVGAGALAADRQAAAVADATIAIDRLEAFEVRGDFAAKVTFEHPFVLRDDVENLVELLLREILRSHIGIEPDFFHELIGTGGPDPVDVTEGIRDFLLRGNIDAEETRHGGWEVLKN